jgi:hypothetical protein
LCLPQHIGIPDPSVYHNFPHERQVGRAIMTVPNYGGTGIDHGLHRWFLSIIYAKMVESRKAIVFDLSCPL